MPLTISLGERSRVTCRDEDAMSSNQRVGLMTPAAQAWQQQDASRNLNSQVLIPFFKKKEDVKLVFLTVFIFSNLD